MRARSVGAVLVLSVIGVLLLGASEGQEALTKRDAQGPVTVVVTLMPASAQGASLKAKVALDTHSVALDDVAFERAVVLQMPDGTEVPPTTVEQASGSGHHRQAVLVFAPVPQPGSVRIVVRNVGGVAVRTFIWDR